MLIIALYYLGTGSYEYSTLTGNKKGKTWWLD